MDPFLLRRLDLPSELADPILGGPQPAEDGFDRSAVSLFQGGETAGCRRGRLGDELAAFRPTVSKCDASETMRRHSSRRRFSEAQWPKVGQRPANVVA